MKSIIASILPVTLKKLFYLLPKGDPYKLSIIFLLMLVAAGLEVAGIGMIPAFVAIVADPETVMKLEWIQPLLNYLEIQNDTDLLIWGSVALVLVFVVKSIYIIAFNYFEARFIFRRFYTLSRRLMSSYMRAPYTFHLQRNTAELLRNITVEVKVVVNVVVTFILKMAREAIIATAILGFLFVVEPLITLIVILLSGLGAGSFILFNRKKMKDYGEEEQERRSEMIKAVNQGLGGIKDARVLNREEEFIEKFGYQANKSTRLLAYIKFIQQIPKPVVETTAVVGMLLIAVLLVWEGRPMNAIIPILTLFAMATVRLMPSVQQISSQYTNLRYNLVSIEPVFNDLRELEKTKAQFDAKQKNDVPVSLQRQLDVTDLWYSYPGSDEHALCDVSFSIPKGKAIAFVGESGAGKTTIVDVLLGLLEPTKGTIEVDGFDIQNHLSAWQRNIGYIPQSIYLSDDSLRSNIAFGLPEIEIDDEKVKKAVELAQLESMVANMPDGLDTILGEHGTRISGGQRQRVGIARALYHDPEVLVMDEATSALDNITEKQITNAISALIGDRTIIMIAHRLTTVKDCDVLYFMEEGKIIQQGTYEELLDTNEHFREMAMEV